MCHSISSFCNPNDFLYFTLQSKRDSMWWMFTSHYKTKRCFHATQCGAHCATAEHFSATFSAEATEWKPAATAKNICSCWQSWKYIQFKYECVLIPRWNGEHICVSGSLQLHSVNFVHGCCSDLFAILKLCPLTSSQRSNRAKHRETWK